MARENKTEFAVLGCLTVKPMSGYDMREFIEETFGYFWHESYGQLYPTLKKLHERNLVSRAIEKQDGAPDRHVYNITRAGRKHFEDWLRAETDPPRLRVEHLLKLFFGPEIGPDASVEQIEKYVEGQAARLKIFEQLDRRFEADYDQYEHRPYWYATLRYGIYIARARVRWGRETIERLQELESAGPNKLKRKNRSISQ